MKTSPDEIRNKQFNKSFRGYDVAAVNRFLIDLSTDLEEDFKRSKELAEKAAELEIQLKDYKSMEKMIQQTLMHAQESSAKAVENARKEAELLSQKTEMKVTEMLDNARKQLSSLKEQITIHNAKKDSILARLKMLLNSELDLIKTLETDAEFKNVDVPKHSDSSEIDDIIKNL
ncbi:MAG: DivIVA domain-containing protein [Bacteroidota bacterium]